jgi:hypothetical protein
LRSGRHCRHKSEGLLNSDPGGPKTGHPGGKEIQNPRNGLRRNLEAFDVVEGYGQIAAWRAIIGCQSLIVP